MISQKFVFFITRILCTQAYRDLIHLLGPQQDKLEEKELIEVEQHFADGLVEQSLV